MNKINFPRKGLDGKIYSQTEIENWYWKQIENVLKRKPNNFKFENKEKLVFLYIKRNLKKIVLANPYLQKRYISVVDQRYNNLFFKYNKLTSYGFQILKYFSYSEIRNSILVGLAKKINIKTCIYCNANYTLVIENQETSKALFEYDHFFPKNKYPFLSISLYNLIPSCSSCNLLKSSKSLSFDLHPYIFDISSLFKFVVKDPLNLWLKNNQQNVTIDILPSQVEYSDLVKELCKSFKLKETYERHKDIVQEVFTKVYLKSYYGNPNNFPFLKNKEISAKRLLLGNYESPLEIELRPLSKFIQDIWQQANNEE